MKVAVIDDEREVIDIISQTLNSRGLECFVTDNPLLLIDRMEIDHEIGVVISDVDMPGMSGIDMASRILAGRSDVNALHFIFITGLGTTDTVIDALRIGATDFLHKPFKPSELLPRVERAIVACEERRVTARRVREIEISAASAEAQRATLVAALGAARGELAITEAELAAAHKARSAMFAVLSHELRTPLIPIIGFSSLLADGAPASQERVRELAKLIHGAGADLLTLIQTALDILDLEVAPAHKTEERASLGALLAYTVARRSADADRSGIRIELVMEQELDVRMDVDRLKRALDELVDNALKASPRGGVIAIHVRQMATGRVEITIDDEGEGVDDTIIADLARPFKQADMSTTRAWGGVGLGLAFAFRVAQVHGGALTLERLKPKGTRASISWPA